MQKPATYYFTCLALVCGMLCFGRLLQAQGCINADFSEGNFTGWSGTYTIGACTDVSNNRCKCSPINPYETPGFNQGPNNNPADDATNEYSEVITTTAGGNDALITSLGGSMPVVFPGGPGYAARIGNMWQNVSEAKTGDGESISYSFLVTTANCNFTYHYAVVLYNGGHTPGQQATFTISMTAGSGDSISCAAYQVDATTAATVGGFSNVDSIYWKPWSSVVVPLYNYIGQTVTITFTTRGCIPKGCAGKHYAYAYISAECAPLNLQVSTALNCGQLDTLIAPAGSATYSWTGPGIVGSSTSRVLTFNQPGEYVVTMTTFGNTACSFTMDTLIAGTNPRPNFYVPIACAGSPADFVDVSTPANISSYQWSFGDGGTANTANPTHTYADTGTYPVTLAIVAGPCSRDTTINIVVVPPPTSTFTTVSPECEGSNSNIVYTGNANAGFTYTWNFDGGTGQPVTGQGPLNISWQLPGVKTITLTVSEGACTSLPDTQYVLVKPYPGMTLTPYTTICLGSSTVLTAANATYYTWAANPTLSDTNTSTVIATPTVTTTYSVTGTNTNCISMDTVTVAVNPVPTSSFTAASPVCIGQNTPVVYTGNGGAAASYNWNFDGATIATGAGTGPYSVNWLTPGAKYIALTVSSLGCDSTTTDTVNIFSTPPSPTLTADTFLGCPDLQVCFTSTVIGGTIGYSWHFGDGDTSAQQNTCHTYATAGVYTVSFRVALSPECVYDTTLTNLVTVIPLPVAAFTANPTVIQQPVSLVDFTNQTTGAVSYLWNFGFADFGAQSIGTSTDADPNFNFTQYGLYNVTLYAYNTLGCPDSVSHRVTVLPAQNYFIPNVFSPNADGNNDVFFVEMQPGAIVLSFQIFDRWGEKVHDGPYAWDGAYKGQKAPQGVYVYIATIQLVDQQQAVEARGSVTLVR